MTSAARLGLVSVSLALLLLPLALARPGMPTHLKADEAAYFAMALSLAHDGDLRLEQEDVDRLFRHLPYGPVDNLILMTRDGWRTVSFGKPWVYSLFAAPFARLLGLPGMFLLNAALTVAMLWMGAAHLRRGNDDGIAALFAGGYFVLSSSFAYVWWAQPEVFGMAAVAACLFWGLPRDEEEGLPHPRRDLALAALSGAALALAVYNKPMVALLGLAPLLGHLRRRRARAAVAWLLGAGGCLLLLAATSWALTGTPTSYLGMRRGGFKVCGPGTMPVTPEGASATGTAASDAPTATATTTAASRAAGSGGDTLASAAPRAGAPTRSPAAGGAAVATPAAAPSPSPPAPPPPSGGAVAAAQSPTGNAWSWLLRPPDTSWSELADNLGYFLWGRHTGLLLYLPFAALATLLFVLHRERGVERWVLLASLAGVALFFLVQIAWNWQGGGGFVGNRYFVIVYPAFLFLVRRIRPRVVVAVGYAAGALFLGQLLLYPFGAPVPEPTLQAHVRGAPLRHFPLELTLRNVPGYHRLPLHDLRLVGRRDLLLPRGEEVWLRGATPVELWLLADRPLGATTWELRSPAGDERLRLRFGAFRQSFAPRAGEALRVELPARAPDRAWKVFCPGSEAPGRGKRERCTLHAWRLVVESAGGRISPWTRDYPPPSCPGWPSEPPREETFFVGAALVYLGAGETLAAPVYAVDWLRVSAPPRATPGEELAVRVALVNRSAATWPSRGGARVRLSYHWRDIAGRLVVADGERSELPRDVQPGETLRTVLRVVAPPAPGTYVLELDPVFERVAWFSDHGVAPRRLTVEVAAP